MEEVQVEMKEELVYQHGWLDRFGKDMFYVKTKVADHDQMLQQVTKEKKIG